MPVRPLHDKVLVRRQEEAEVSKGGLYIPTVAKEKPQRGTVLAVGKGKLVDGQIVTLDVFEGDTVLFGKYSGSELDLDGDKVLILREDEILAVIT